MFPLFEDCISSVGIYYLPVFFEVDTMRKDEDNNYKIEVVLRGMSDDYRLEGLVDRYDCYVENFKFSRGFAWAVKCVGIVLVVVGLLTLIPVIYLAAGIFTWGDYLERSSRGTPVTLEVYMLQNYCFVGPKGCDPSMGILVKHLQDGDFRISRVRSHKGIKIKSG